MTARASRRKTAPGVFGATKQPDVIRFEATLLNPVVDVDTRRQRGDGDSDWAFLKLPCNVSARLPSRGQVTVEGLINGGPFVAKLEPDGKGSHWLKVDRAVRKAAGHPEVGDNITLEIAPVPPEREPELTIPPERRQALTTASSEARHTWKDITPAARRDSIHWITSAKQAATRAKRMKAACDMLAKGKGRPCCFDRSRIYGGGLRCPVAADDAADTAG